MSSFDYCPFSEQLLIASGDNGLIKLIDIRNYSSLVKEYKNNASQINKIVYSKVSKTEFYTAEQNHKVHVWDIVGWSKQKESKFKNHVVFIHGFHKAPVTNLC